MPMLYETISLEGEKATHYKSPFGLDYALCGLSVDDDPIVNQSVREVKGWKASCQDCLAVVRFCSKLKS